MKHSSKKVLSILLIFILVFACCYSVLAEEPSPRWKELSTLSCRLERQSGFLSNAHVYSHAASWNNDNTINLTITIQKWNGSSYANTAYSWSSSGKGSATVDTNMSLSAGNYIAHAVVTVYNSSGNYVETVTQDSSEIII